MKRRQLIQGVAAGVASGPWVHAQAQHKYAEYERQTMAINFPAHPHHDQAEKLFSELAAETSIKVERDRPADETPRRRRQNSSALLHGADAFAQ